MSLDVEFFERIARLGREGQSFAIATVVGRRAPVSSHLGDRAIIFADGRMEGFVGGACSHEIVRMHALQVMALNPMRYLVSPALVAGVFFGGGVAREGADQDSRSPGEGFRAPPRISGSRNVLKGS